MKKPLDELEPLAFKRDYRKFIWNLFKTSLIIIGLVFLIYCL